MYRNVWEMYGKNLVLEFIRMKPLLNLNLMYGNVVELDYFYLCN